MYYNYGDSAVTSIICWNYQLYITCIHEVGITDEKPCWNFYLHLCSCVTEVGIIDEKPFATRISNEVFVSASLDVCNAS